MYAIIQCGGRQLKVTPGIVVTVDRREGAAGDEVTFEPLLIGKDNGEIVAGSPSVAGARVVGVLSGEAKGPKLRVFKKKRRKGMRRTIGHRTQLTRVEITDIQA